MSEITFEELVSEATEAYNNARGPLPTCRIESVINAIMDKIGTRSIHRVYTGNGDFDQYRAWEVGNVVILVDK